MEPTLRVLPPNEVKARWLEIAPLLDKAVLHGRGELAVDDILDLVASQQMFVAGLEQEGRIHLAIAAEVIRYPRKRVLNLAFAGGTRSGTDASYIWDRLQEMARLLNASAVQCYCRESIARYLEKLQPDVERAYIVVEKKVADENLQ